jgi:hypothetical protein
LNFEWKIEGVKATDGLITQAKYHCRANQKDLWVATEGTWVFKDAKLKTPYADVTESMVVDWIKAEDNGVIEGRLAEQVNNLANDSAMTLPWSPQVFTPKIEEEL